jgi:hypothetical protein
MLDSAAGQPVTIELDLPYGDLTCQWINTQTAEVTTQISQSKQKGAAVRKLTSPGFKLDIALQISDASRAPRQAADAKLDELQRLMPQKTPEQLIEMLKLGSIYTDKVEYFVARDGNHLIETELARRGDAAKSALQKHVQDQREIFTGDNGDHRPIGQMCGELLKKLRRL